MDDVKRKIVRVAKVLSVVATLAKVVVIIMMVVTVLQMVAAFTLNTPYMPEFFDGTLSDIESLLGESPIFNALYKTADLSTMEPVYQKAIELFITLLSLVVLLRYAVFFKEMLCDIVAQQRPFSPQTARRMRNGSYGLLLLAAINPTLGVVMFLIMRFFALAFEYGAYLQQKADETTHIQEEIIVSFAEITENKSGQTGQHIRRVSEYSRVLAQTMGYGEAETENLRLASIMHDIGKLLVPTEILEKPARLTDAEFAEIKKHTTYGGQLLNHVDGDVMALAREVALQHHERADGRGYPEGLSGEAIGLAGRIVAVADVYDALTSRRSYKDAWKAQDAYDEILRCSGTQFDPEVVEAFKRCYPQIDEIRQKYADKP